VVQVLGDLATQDLHGVELVARVGAAKVSRRHPGCPDDLASGGLAALGQGRVEGARVLDGHERRHAGDASVQPRMGSQQTDSAGRERRLVEHSSGLGGDERECRGGGVGVCADGNLVET